MLKRGLFVILFVISFFLSIGVVSAANTEFFVISDVHTGGASDTCKSNKYACINNGEGKTSTTNAKRFKQFLKKANLKGNTNRYILIVGDVVDRAQEDQYKNFANILKSDTVKSRTYASIGNHELRPTNAQKKLKEAEYDKLRALFKKYVGAIDESKIFGVTNKKVKVVKIGTNYEHRPIVEWTSNSSGGTSIYQYDSPDTMSFLEKSIKSAKAAGQTVIVMSHEPANKTVQSSGKSPHRIKKNNKVTVSNKLNDIIKNYPNVILVSGHTHKKFENTTSKDKRYKWIYQDPTNSTYIHDGTGIKGTRDGGETHFVKITFSDQKNAKICQQKLSANGNTIATGKCFDWSWETVTYKANNGTGTTKTTYKYQKVAKNNFKRTGYTFKSWNTRADGKGTTYKTGTEIKKGNTTLYAQWSVNKYKITFNANGGASAPSALAYPYSKTEQLQVPAKKPVKTGYTFKGWSTNKNAKSASYGSGKKITRPNKNVTFYAVWGINQLKIKYNANGGTLKKEHGKKYAISNGVITENGNSAILHGTYGGKLATSGLYNYNSKDNINLEKKGYYIKAGAEWKNEAKKTFNQATRYAVSALADLKLSDKTITLYANWIPQTYKITYNLNGGTAASGNPNSYTIETADIKVNAPTKDNAVFTGWTGSNGTTPEEFLTIKKGSTGNKTYNANYADGACKLSFYTDGGSSIEPLVVTPGTKIEKPEDPTKEGFLFEGWYSDEELTKPYTFNVMPEKDTTIYAKWNKNTYTVSFETNGGSSVESIEVKKGEGLKKFEDPTKEGYAFIGWYKDSSLTEKYTFEEEIKGDTTLYAKWDKNYHTITIYDTVDNKKTDILIASGETFIKPTDPTKAGYTFAGWFSDEALTKEFDFDEKITENKNIYTKWENAKYKVTFEKNNDEETQVVEVSHGSTVTMPETPTKKGYRFEGWYKDEDLTEKYNFNTVLESDITLYAKWEAKKYIVTFETNGGTSIEPIETTELNALEEPEEPTKEGYKFASWYKDKELTKLFSFGTNITENITLYAKWVTDEYLISYELDGGINNESNPSSSAGKTEIALKEATKEGYKFVGWYTDADLTQEIKSIPADIKEDITLYAKWEKQVYKISFETNGGNKLEDYTYDPEKAIELPEATKEGYTFAGWYKDKELTEAFNNIVKGNITLYAKWNLETKEIRFETNGGSYVYSIKKAPGEEVEKPTDPIRENYRFAGWYEDKELTKLYSFTVMPEENITLYAKWVSNNENIIEYDNEGGVIDPSNPTNFGDGDNKEIGDATKENDTFIGWYTDDNKKVTNTNQIEGDQTLHARWESVGKVSVPNTGSARNIVIVALGIVLLGIPVCYIFSKYRSTNKKKGFD